MSYSVSSSTNKFSIIVPRRFSPFLFAFIPLWIVLWIAFALKAYRSGQGQPRIALLFFGAVSVLFFYSWLWNLGGREELHFTGSTLRYRRVLFGISTTREFSMVRIAEPHFVQSRSAGKSRIPSGIGFSYGGKEVRLGDHLTQREAKEIVAALVKHLPQLSKCWGHYVEGLPELNEDMTLNLK
jgi:hypothetical protein